MKLPPQYFTVFLNKNDLTQPFLQYSVSNIQRQFVTAYLRFPKKNSAIFKPDFCNFLKSKSHEKSHFF